MDLDCGDGPRPADVLQDRRRVRFRRVQGRVRRLRPAEPELRVRRRRRPPRLRAPGASPPRAPPPRRPRPASRRPPAPPPAPPAHARHPRPADLSVTDGPRWSATQSVGSCQGARQLGQILERAQRVVQVGARGGSDERVSHPPAQALRRGILEAAGVRAGGGRARGRWRVAHVPAAPLARRGRLGAAATGVRTDGRLRLRTRAARERRGRDLRQRGARRGGS